MAFYLDSDVFIFASVSDDGRAKKALEILTKIVKGEAMAMTASLTLDEVLWIILKQRGNREIAIQHALKILEMPNLHIISVDESTIRSSLRLMKGHKSLKPRDAIHLAAMLAKGLTEIVSDDSDFDKIQGIKRIKLG